MVSFSSAYLRKREAVTQGGTRGIDNPIPRRWRRRQRRMVNLNDGNIMPRQPDTTRFNQTFP